MASASTRLLPSLLANHRGRRQSRSAPASRRLVRHAWQTHCNIHWWCQSVESNKGACLDSGTPISCWDGPWLLLCQLLSGPRYTRWYCLIVGAWGNCLGYGLGSRVVAGWAHSGTPLVGCSYWPWLLLCQLSIGRRYTRWVHYVSVMFW